MFCQNCGAQLPDGLKFCTNCGAKIDIPGADPVNVFQSNLSQNPSYNQPQPVPQPQQVQQPQPVPQPQPMQQPQQAPYVAQGYAPQYAAAPAPAPVKKKSKAPAFIALAVIVLLLIGAAGFFGYNWYMSPDNVATRAFMAGDYETVSELYGDLSDEKADEFSDALLQKFLDLEAGYEKGSVEYSEANDFGRLLSKNILKGNKKFENAYSLMNSIESSRKAYKEAEKLFAAEDYEAAIAKYYAVIPEDTENYNDSLEKIDVCRLNMIPDIAGLWLYEYDLGNLSEELGVDIDTASIVLDVYVEFREDGTGSITANTDVMIDNMVGPVKEILMQEFGISEATLSSYLALAGYSDIQEVIREMMHEYGPLPELFDIDNNYRKDFSYEVMDGYIVYDGAYVTEFEIGGDWLTITTDQDAFFPFIETGLDPPYLFGKTYG